MSEQSTFDEIIEYVPLKPTDSIADWVKWVRDEGYARRMHGGVLHGLIVDYLAGYTPPQGE